MLGAIGLVIVFVLIFGGYIASGGKIGIILEALPHELPMLMGGAIGAYFVANSGTVLKKTLKEFMKSFKGSKWKKQDYKDLLCLLFTLCKLMKSKGLIAVESHIEKPEESSIFKQYPRVMHDHFSVELICDTLRTLTMGMENPTQIEEVIDKQIEKHHHEACGPGQGLQGMADGLPAIGIVVAVLGVVKTMGSINEPPAILGAMIGGALCGTFMGVFVAYCVVGPVAARNLAIHNEEQQFYFIIRDVLVAHLKGMAPQISMEMGRGHVPGHFQPHFAEMEEASSAIKIEG
ncbi:MAG: flagellar motor stator protein MotA [Pseudomonadota bacterium]|nr:flagellar motor stator protein MotA [Pseudomonadota bacterium]MDE3038641.1 flagellar motor stator protein MotA [Pseudomonadota bacterium]